MLIGDELVDVVVVIGIEVMVFVCVWDLVWEDLVCVGLVYVGLVCVGLVCVGFVCVGFVWEDVVVVVACVVEYGGGAGGHG